MPFTVGCPHCRAVRYRVPLAKRGEFFPCGKCGHEFLLVPDDPGTHPLVEYKMPDELFEFTALDNVKLDGESPPVRTAPLPRSEPTEVVEEEPEPAARPAVEPPAHDDPEDAVRMGLIAVAVMGLAVVATQFPYGRLISVVLAIVGLALGGGALLGLEKRRWLGWVGVGLNGFALLLALLLPDWLGGPTWVPPADPNSGPQPIVALGRDGTPAKPAEWVDARAAVWQQGDVRVEIASVTAEPGEPKSADPAKKMGTLRVNIKVMNVGVSRGIEFDGWNLPPGSQAPRPTLTPASGSPLPLRPADGPVGATVFPGKTAAVTLAFESPKPPADDLRLELPGAAFGGADPVKFAIPAAMVRPAR